MSRKVLFGLLATFALALPYSGVQASMLSSTADTSVLASQSLLIEQSGANTTALSIPGAGELFVTLTDLNFPAPFASLQYALSDAAGTMVPLTNAGTVISLDLTGPTMPYANVFETLGGTDGLYNLTASFLSNSSTVTLPSSVVSMAGGGLLLLLLSLCADSFAQAHRRNEQHAPVTTSVA
jgi:hypothetical protein